ncbi:MAG: DUF2442 domain-containing protein [Oscillospiraceae bacterium]|nr:DUF2442 domain-containing protein [Oscillospiraceae bacterium]
MYKDNIIHAEPLGPRVLEVFPTDDYKLFLTFNNGENRIFDVKPLLSMRVFESLKNKDFFKLVKTGYGTVVWPNDIDYCPDTLYEESESVIRG